MRLQLRNNEEIVAEAHFHWLAYLAAGFWALLGTPILISAIFEAGSNKGPNGASEGGFISVILWGGLIVYGPILYKFLRNKTKRYLITNQRFYIEDGIIAKEITDIPLSKINDVGFRQGVVQRLFNSCNLAVMTGNSKPTMIKNIANSKEFASVLSNAASEQKGA